MNVECVKSLELCEFGAHSVYNVLTSEYHFLIVILLWIAFCCQHICTCSWYNCLLPTSLLRLILSIVIEDDNNKGKICTVAVASGSSCIVQWLLGRCKYQPRPNCPWTVMEYWWNWLMSIFPRDVLRLFKHCRNDFVISCSNFGRVYIPLYLPYLCLWRCQTRKPSYRWQTRATRKHAKIVPIRRAYNVVADNTGLSSFV